MKRRRICFIVSTIYSANVFLKAHIQALSEEYDVYVVANFADENDYKVLNNLAVVGHCHVKIVRDISLWNDLLASLKLARYFKKMKFDAIHSLTPKAGIVAQLAGWLARVRIRIHIFTGQVWCNMAGMKRRILVFVDRMIAWFATHILVDGLSQKEFLVGNEVVSPKKATVLGNGSIAGVNISKFSSTGNMKIGMREKFNIPCDRIVFAFMGRLNQDKGVPELLFAFSKLAALFSDVLLVIFGSDEENMVASFSDYPNIRVGENLIYFGNSSSPEMDLQVADVFCLPSHREGFGLSVIEASALSLPIICSDAYGLRDTIVDNQTGIRHQVNNVDSLLEAMIYMMDNNQRRIDMGNAGREYVVHNFSQEHLTALWVDYYKCILK